MRPPMNQEISYEQDVLDENGNPITDKYGRALTEQTDSIARVQMESNTVFDAEGRSINVMLTIDVPPNVNPSLGTVIEYVLANGERASGRLVSKSEALNLAGNRVYYRTLYVE